MASANNKATMLPNPAFSAEQAAQELRKAMKGIGTNETKVIEVIGSHSNEQRQEITKSFKTQFGRDLRADLKSELGGRFEDLVLALLEPPIQYDAKELHDAISGIGTNEGTLIEILCSRSCDDVTQIKSVYKTLYKKELEADVTGDTSGHFRRLLVSQLTANREQGGADPTKAAADTQAFYNAGKKKIGTDESEFNRILSVRSYPQLCEFFDDYRRQYGREIEQVIKDETSGDVADGYLAIVRIAKSIPDYFAERLYKSMKGAGTKDKVLIRVVVSRCEVDMVDIKKAFEARYNKTLRSFIDGDTTGDYRKLLFKLIGEA